jgi:hypothetical protein
VWVGSVWLCDCVSVLEELIEERKGGKSIKYSGVWDKSVWLF